MGTILLIVLVLLLLGALPTFPYSRRWGYAPSGVLSILLVVLVVMLLVGWLPWGFGPTTVAPTPLP